ncbi:Multidrug resistance protein fer6 [Fusarium oxysporum f. sp. albedinis]|nr:Multidrug resistance protein fer6 [Fusarium oxysporum f. sp. albedinis]
MTFHVFQRPRLAKSPGSTQPLETSTTFVCVYSGLRSPTLRGHSIRFAIIPPVAAHWICTVLTVPACSQQRNSVHYFDFNHLSFFSPSFSLPIWRCASGVCLLSLFLDAPFVLAPRSS